MIKALCRIYKHAMKMLTRANEMIIGTRMMQIELTEIVYHEGNGSTEQLSRIWP